VSPRRLIVFARLPVEGRVKTRLAETLGTTAALEAYRRLLGATLALADHTVLECRELRFDAPDGALPEAAWALPATLRARGWLVGPQQGPDLGDRMHEALGTALSAGDTPVLIGCDCPVLTPDDLAEAFAALHEHDAVFAPAEDGGYALVGVSRPLPGIFTAMPWGTAGVMPETRTRLLQEGRRFHELRTVWDVDVQADWERWLAGDHPGGPNARTGAA